jgi:murein DD-endopeptidase MepM/ murein hydrolase activator NlpD
MTYSADFQGRTHRVAVTETGLPATVRLDETTYEVDFAPIGGSLFSVIIQGRSYEIDVVEEGEGSAVFYVDNKSYAEITLTFEFQLNNMTATAGAPSISVFPPLKVSQAFSLHQTYRDLPWKYEFEYAWKYGRRNAEHEEGYSYAPPYPAGFSVLPLQGFHGSSGHFGEDEYGVDWGMPWGTSVCAAREGVVVAVVESCDEGGADESCTVRGNHIVVQHRDGTVGVYAHLAKEGAEVLPGQLVKRGEVLGYSGNTGFGVHPYLHFGVYSPLDGKTYRSHPAQFAKGSVAE